MSDDFREAWHAAVEMCREKQDRIYVLELALQTAARRFNFMAGAGGLINGIDPKVGYHECIAALEPERGDK